MSLVSHWEIHIEIRHNECHTKGLCAIFTAVNYTCKMFMNSATEGANALSIRRSAMP
jgi:hypothetical protein